MAITQLYSIIIYHKVGDVPSTFLHNPQPNHNHNNHNKKNSSSKLQSCCFGLRETGSLRNGAIAIKAQISWLESTLFWLMRSVFGLVLELLESTDQSSVWHIFVVGVKDHVATSSKMDVFCGFVSQITLEKWVLLHGSIHFMTPFYNLATIVLKDCFLLLCN